MPLTSRPLLALALTALLTRAHAQQPASAGLDSDPAQATLPEAPPSPSSGMARPSFGGPPHTGSGQTFDWSRFLTGATQTAFRAAVPRGSMQGGGGPVFSTAGGSGLAGSGSNYFGSGSMGSGPSANFGGPSGGPGGGGGFGGNSAFALGSGLLHSMAAASGGALGTSLNAITRVTDLPRTGFSVPGKTGGLDFHLSGSLGDGLLSNLTPMSGSGGTGGSGNTGAANGSGMGGSSGMAGGGSNFGSSQSGSGAQPGGGGRGGHSGPQLSLKLKF